MAAETVRTYGQLDIIVNNAGIGLTKLFLHTTLEKWERVLRTDLTGVFLCAQAAARVMVKQGGGRIINIASLSGQRGGTGRAAYGAAKAGVTALTKVLSVELAPYNITVNEIAPGPVNTEMTAVTHDAATRQAYYNLIPMRRYAERDMKGRQVDTDIHAAKPLGDARDSQQGECDTANASDAAR